MDDRRIQVDLKEDSFIHFTYDNRADQILESGKLLLKAPYYGSGIGGVQAISVNHGEYVPTTQTNHLHNKIDRARKDRRRDTEDYSAKVVAIHFKTDTLPYFGRVEEVIWDKDVNLIAAKKINERQAINMLNPRNHYEDDPIFIYESLLLHLLSK